jgi:hypothetical protein
VAVRDPDYPTPMLPAYDSGDHLHPNDWQGNTLETHEETIRCAAHEPVLPGRGSSLVFPVSAAAGPDMDAVGRHHFQSVWARSA